MNNITSDITPVIYGYITSDIAEAPQSVSHALITVKTLLSDDTFKRGFRQYVFSRYTRDDARHRFNYVIKFKDVLSDPMVITRLTYKQAHHLLNGLASVRDYIKLLGYNDIAIQLDVYIKSLRKLAPRNNNVVVLEYEIDKSIIDKALEQINKVIESKSIIWALEAIIDFFTGLRGPEVVYMINNWPRLRKIVHNDAVIIELGYVRKSKKAWVTIMPLKLALIIDELVKQGLRAGHTSIQNLRDKADVNISIFRKAHLAILSSKLMELEIKLLHGRVSEVTVKHYTKHLREIAEKYIEAYRPYLWILDRFAEKCKNTAKQEQEIVTLSS